MKKTAFLMFVLTLLLVFSLSLYACNKAQSKDDDIVFGTETLALTEEEGLAKLNALGTENGYEIEFDYVYFVDEQYSGHYKVGQKGDTYWCYEEREGVGTLGTAIIIENDIATYFNYNNDWEFEAEYDVSGDLKEQKLNAYSYGYSQILYYASGMSGHLNKADDVDVAGRSQFGYKHYSNTADGKVASYQIAVDKEYGFTSTFKA
ncbi:MAG: hypothetical protein MJ193_02830, partial [Clostridia bacterium]|nr:hypothetical protein [Clostridia bacterium]